MMPGNGGFAFPVRLDDTCVVKGMTYRQWLVGEIAKGHVAKYGIETDIPDLRKRDISRILQFAQDLIDAEREFYAKGKESQ